MPLDFLTDTFQFSQGCYFIRITVSEIRSLPIKNLFFYKNTPFVA
jgi:hypothetical protein